MIKKIQLRGISRTPSDRMNADGGCAESLNIHIDQDESAPDIVAKDVSKEKGLVSLTSGFSQPVYIHKTPSFEHLITWEHGYLDFPNDDGTFFYLAIGDVDINSISAVGNTIIITTEDNVYYVLYKKGSYHSIGNHIPEPAIEFQTKYNDIRRSGSFEVCPKLGTDKYYKFVESAWQEGLKMEETPASILEIQNHLWGEIKKRLDALKKDRQFIHPFFVRYAVRLYDGSYVNQSVPILLGSATEEFVTISGSSYPTQNRTTMGYSLPETFNVKAFLKGWDMTGWEDVIASIDIFASTDIMRPLMDEGIGSLKHIGSAPVESIIMKFKTGGFKSKYDAIEDEIISKNNFYLIKSFSIKDLSLLMQGYDIADCKDLFNKEELVLRDRLPDRLQNLEMIPNRTEVYNNRLVALGAKLQINTGYQFMPSSNCHPHSGGVGGPCHIAYYVLDHTNVEHKVLGRTIGSPETLFKDYETIYPDEGPDIPTSSVIQGFISHPDVNCAKAEVYFPDTDKVYTISMKKHPTLNCSYGYWGLGKGLENLPTSSETQQKFLSGENRDTIVNNKLFFSEINNPFVFPLSGNVTMSSKVIGMAIATKALSEGQFGQFPIYVFTEDGIWALSVSSDGSILSSSPLSREVCLNAKSITPIDDAVIFTSKKGVSLLQGSSVVNLSPNMNGEHYRIESAARRIIESEYGFCNYVDILDDATPFMSFIKDAICAYDYEGNRLIFINENESYSYVYAIDTHTWHKYAPSGTRLVSKLNSYPECLIIGKSQRIITNLQKNESTWSRQEQIDYFKRWFHEGATEQEICDYLDMKGSIDITSWWTDGSSALDDFISDTIEYTNGEIVPNIIGGYNILDLSTILDSSIEQNTERGVIITRPFDLGETDVYKTIKNIRIRGKYGKRAVRFILLASNDGKNFQVINTLRGKAWKLFRLIILADLTQYDRISWAEIEYDTRFTNRLR